MRDIPIYTPSIPTQSGDSRDNSGDMDNSGDIIINSIPVKAGRPCADIDCILEQRKTFVKRAGGVADRRGNTLAAGRGPRKGLRMEERRWRREDGGGGRKTEVGGWRIHVRT